MFLSVANLPWRSFRTGVILPAWKRWYSHESVKCTLLDNRKIIEVKGKDSYDFLQGLVTNDVTLLPEMKCLYAMMLNQHGRILNDLILYHRNGDDENGILLECESSHVNSLMKTLKLYKLRKKLTITLQENLSVIQALDSQDNKVPSSKNFQIVTSVNDPRAPLLGQRIIAENVTGKDVFSDVSTYHLKRVKNGIPEGEADLPPAKSFPLECNLDYMNGVSFHKGCYIGQELTARTKFTGVIRKRLLPVEISGSGPVEPETSVYTPKGKSAGKIRSTLNDTIGLALIRLNYMNEVLTTKSGHEVKCHIPPWWPSKDGTDFSDGVCGPTSDSL